MGVLSESGGAAAAFQKYIAAAHNMPSHSHQPQQLWEYDTSSGTTATIGPWDSCETPRHPSYSGDNQQQENVRASCSTGVAYEPGSWCESVETPIACVRPAKQVHIQPRARALTCSTVTQMPHTLRKEGTSIGLCP